MTLNLNNSMYAADLNSMLRSWLAWEVYNIPFANILGRTQLLLGLPAGPTIIPKPSDWVLVGGANTMLPSPAMFDAVADAHLLAQLGLEATRGPCSGWMMTEHWMDESSTPLKTPYGDLPMKCMDLCRTVLLTPAQAAKVTPMGKLKDVAWFDEEQFEALVATGQLSFPHQVAHVRGGFGLYDDDAEAT